MLNLAKPQESILQELMPKTLSVICFHSFPMQKVILSETLMANVLLYGDGGVCIQDLGVVP